MFDSSPIDEIQLFLQTSALLLVDQEKLSTFTHPVHTVALFKAEHKVQKSAIEQGKIIKYS